MASRSSVVVAAIVALALPALAACGSTPALEEQLERDRPAVAAKLSAVNAVAVEARRLPPVSSDAVTLPVGGAPFALIKQLGPPHPAANATFAYLDDLDKLGELSPIPHRVPSSTLASDCAALVQGGRAFAAEPLSDVPARRTPPPANQDSAWMLLPRCKALRYLVVVRPGKVTSPIAHKEDRTFDAGRFEGDALVFDVSTGQHLGGFGLAVTSRPELKVRTTDDPQAWVDAHFRAQIAQELALRIMRAIPTARLD